MLTTLFNISTYVFIAVCLVDFGFALRNAIKIRNKPELLPLAVVEMFTSLSIATINAAVLLSGMVHPGQLDLGVLLVYRISFISLFLSLIGRRYLDLKLWKV
jgi:hypothetical protein